MTSKKRKKNGLHFSPTVFFAVVLLFPTTTMTETEDPTEETAWGIRSPMASQGCMFLAMQLLFFQGINQ